MTTPHDPASRPDVSSAQLLNRAKAGDSRALSRLFHREGRALRRWARGRLPGWARSFSDTADLVQEALFQTFRRMDRFEDRGRGSLQAYLRQAVTNRIRDEVRRVGRKPADAPMDAAIDVGTREPSPLDLAVDAEHERLYKHAISQLSDDERMLVVGRLELGYNYEQLGLISNRATPHAARMAVRRALIKMAETMSAAQQRSL